MPECLACLSPSASGHAAGPSSDVMHTCGQTMRQLTHLPEDALLAVLRHLTPADVARLQLAIPHREFVAITRDAHLWRLFFTRDFGPSIPPRLYVTAGCLDWQRLYKERVLRERRLDALRDGGWGFRYPARPSSLYPTHHGLIRVTRQGNMHRIRSATADDSASPIVINGRVGRFDWTRTRQNRRDNPGS